MKKKKKRKEKRKKENIQFRLCVCPYSSALPDCATKRGGKGRKVWGGKKRGEGPPAKKHW